MVVSNGTILRVPRTRLRASSMGSSGFALWPNVASYMGLDAVSVSTVALASWSRNTIGCSLSAVLTLSTLICSWNRATPGTWPSDTVWMRWVNPMIIASRQREKLITRQVKTRDEHTIIVDDSNFSGSMSPKALCWSSKLEAADILRNVLSYLSNYCKTLLVLINIVIIDCEKMCYFIWWVTVGWNCNPGYTVTEIGNL